jgi:hypothetical protein
MGNCAASSDWVLKGHLKKKKHTHTNKKHKKTQKNTAVLTTFLMKDMDLTVSKIWMKV